MSKRSNLKESRATPLRSTSENLFFSLHEKSIVVTRSNGKYLKIFILQKKLVNEKDDNQHIKALRQRP
jgi:hypothetical protein